MAGNARGEAALSALRGLGVAVGLTLAGMLALAALVVWAGLSDSALIALNQALKIVSIAAGALFAVKPGGRRGLPLGGCVGLIYIALGYGLVALTGVAMITPKMLAMEMLMGLAFGALCGVVTANLPAKRAVR